MVRLVGWNEVNGLIFLVGLVLTVLGIGSTIIIKTKLGAISGSIGAILMIISSIDALGWVQPA